MPSKRRRDEKLELTLYPTPEQEVELLKLMNGANHLYIPADEIEFYPSMEAYELVREAHMKLDAYYKRIMRRN